MKVILWIFSVLSIAMLGGLVWVMWTFPDLAFREGFEFKGKLYVTVVCVLVAVISNTVVWSKRKGL